MIAGEHFGFFGGFSPPKDWDQTDDLCTSSLFLMFGFAVLKAGSYWSEVYLGPIIARLGT